MAYVQPNSTLHLFKGINLDNRYLHTIYFASESAQDTWFSSKVTSGLTFSNLMYRRYNSNAVKIDIDTTSLLGVTYMRFKNTRTAGKWFYAFVTGVDYVNENTSVVYYEIDVMQTWFIQNGTIRPCMVLREHSNTDVLFDNYEDEPVGSETYEYDYITNCDSLDAGGTDLFQSYTVVVQTSGQPIQGKGYANGLYVGTKYDTRICNSNSNAQDAGGVDDMIADFIGDWDAGSQEQDVVDLFSMPTPFATSTSTTPVNKSVTLPSTIGGYTPKNKKLFNYPFNYLFATTHNGASRLFRWELFPKSSNSKVFKLIGTFIGGGQIMCYPSDYAGVSNNYNEGLLMDDFPKNSYAFDAYEAWVAAGGKTRLETAEKLNNIRSIATAVQQGVETGTGLIGGFIQTGVGAVTFSEAPNLVSANMALGGINKMTSAVTSAVKTGVDLAEAKNKINYQWKDASYRPNEVVGKSAPSLMAGHRALNFYFYNCHIAVSELKRIDDFFSCFGYSEHKVKTPNLTGRQYWNFVQTEGAVIAGDMPSSSKEAIGRIFDGGITFWHNGDNVGNYAQSTSGGSISNPIVS